jgi:hypothetical protein
VVNPLLFVRLIIVSGFNVYPNELEGVIASHTRVLECAVVGVPDEHSGEAVKVFVVRKDPNLSEQVLMDYCKTQFTGYNTGANWYRVVAGTRTPASGFVQPTGLMEGSAGGFNEVVTGDYRWVNLASVASSNTRYQSSDNANAGNTKCIAGETGSPCFSASLSVSV